MVIFYWIILQTFGLFCDGSHKSQGQESTKLRVHQHVAPFFFFRKLIKKIHRLAHPLLISRSSTSLKSPVGSDVVKDSQGNWSSMRTHGHVQQNTLPATPKPALLNSKLEKHPSPIWTNQTVWGPSFFFSLCFPTCFPFDMWVCLCFPPLSIVELGGAGQSCLLVVMHSRHPHCCRAGSTSNSVIQSWPD